MTVLGGNVTVRATYKDKETPGALKYDLNVINGQGTGKYAINKTVEITANPAPEGKEFDKWVVVEDTVAVADITKPKTTLTTKGVDAWVVATYKDIGSVAVDHTLTVVNGSIYSSSNPGKFKRNEAVTLYSKEIKNFDKWVVTSGSVVAILPNENTLNVTIITSDEDTTIEATCKSDASVHTHIYGAWSNDDADHWQECTDAACTDKAGSVKDKAGHVYDDDADTTCNVCGYIRTVTPPTITPDYKFLEGANGKWTKSSDKNLAFRANGEFSKFTGVKVDGTKIDADKYTAVSGSTIVNLKKEYLETLSVGKHTLTVVYTDGECSTEFEIKATSTAKKDTTDKENKSSKTTAAKLDNAKTPKTGDNSNILLWFTLLFSSGVVLMGKAFANKKRKQDR